MSDQDAERLSVTMSVCRSIVADIKAGNIDHGVSIGDMLLSEGPNIAPELLVEIVEAILQLSAVSGGPNAEEYLSERWSELKKIHVKRLRRKS